METEKIRSKLQALLMNIKQQSEAIGVDYTSHTRFLNGGKPSKSSFKKYEKFLKKHKLL